MDRDGVVDIASVRVLDRRRETRFVGNINGSYTLSSHRTGSNAAVPVFACRTQSISPVAAAVTAPVSGEEGEWLTARFDGLGIIRGQIDRRLDDGFVFGIVASDDQRAKLARKIDLLRRRSARVADDKRIFERAQPRDPRSTITLPDGQVLRCFVINLSRSGAAVSANYAPELESPLVVGMLAAKVVRHLDVGFVVQFDAVQDAEGLETLVTGFEPKKP